ncbi:patatin-domain-containing protein [Trichodelitschia bisporula]|uniref:Patatin-like phospholipase domain-containing protein n=1 Tax=Trichodelitschia bisporula TaxID=703511 RepID=A0A6G1I4G9_9PEZI|nr:patatin-domain-containing protein [Trichodelitschia bisporula]
MALLPDTSIFTASFHTDNADIATPDASQARNKRRRRSKSSSGGVLSPLLRFARDPAGQAGAFLSASLQAGSESRGNGEASQQVNVEDDVQEARRQALNLRMSEAVTYSAWRAAATELDKLEGRDEWKAEDEDPIYDAEHVAARLAELEEARFSCDLRRILSLVRTSLTRDLGGMGDLRLYKYAHIGTKRLIERYIEAACAAIQTLVELTESLQEGGGITSHEVLEQLLNTRQAFGRSALLLSGGGTFGMAHIGVVKSLWHAKLLPRIICGSSAGSIVCAVLCTKTDAEIPTVLEEFCDGDLAVFEAEDGEPEGWLRKCARFLKYGSIFDINHLVRVMKGFLGDMTFQEAYNRTRRILNIGVSSASIHELPRLLNFVTSPNVVIWSAVSASCSVPLVFSPASLLAKDPRTGELHPWNPSPQRWIDGSVDNDLPMTRLSEMFNVNHFIVSQVNPHVVPFLSRDTDLLPSASTTEPAPSSTWLTTLSSLARSELLHRMHVLTELGVFPNYLTKLRSVLAQTYSGDITILPHLPHALLVRVLRNPTPEFMRQAMLAGERATWPALARVQNHCSIEMAIDGAVQKVRAGLVFSPQLAGMRRGTLGRTSISRPVSRGGREGDWGFGGVKGGVVQMVQVVSEGSSAKDETLGESDTSIEVLALSEVGSSAVARRKGALAVQNVRHLLMPQA